MRIAELEKRDDLYFKIGKNKPYTGIVVESSGLKTICCLVDFKQEDATVNGFNGMKWAKRGRGNILSRKKEWGLALWYEDGTMKKKAHLTWVKLMVYISIGMQMGIYTWNSHMKGVNHMVSGHGGSSTITI